MSKTKNAPTKATADGAAAEAAANAAELEGQLQQIEQQVEDKEAERDKLATAAESADAQVLHAKALVELGEASQGDVDTAQRKADDAREKARVAAETVSVLHERYRLLEQRWQAERDRYREIRKGELAEQMREQTVEVWNRLFALRFAMRRLVELREECDHERVHPPHENPVHPQLRNVVGADHRDPRQSAGLSGPLRELLQLGYTVDVDRGKVSRNG